MAAVQNKTDRGSMVIKTAPAESSGGADDHTRKNPARVHPRAKNGDNEMRIAAMTGEKKRTPNAVSPQSDAEELHMR
jgi:hypothetical protein